PTCRNVCLFRSSACSCCRRPPRGRRNSPCRRISDMKILILGGTGFLGRHLVNAARTRGHAVTLFNRGKTNPELFSDVEQLHGERDPNLGDGLLALRDRKWDAVIDTCGYVPQIVRASADLLRDAID